LAKASPVASLPAPASLPILSRYCSSSFCCGRRLSDYTITIFPPRPSPAPSASCQSLLTLLVYSIVFVHGLNGHPHHTWATHKPEVFWPADLLPSALEEQHVRILTYGYDANVGVFTDGASKDKIHNHAEHLASRLTANRSVSPGARSNIPHPHR
jgi:hypothetical protein